MDTITKNIHALGMASTMPLHIHPEEGKGGRHVHSNNGTCISQLCANTVHINEAASSEQNQDLYMLTNKVTLPSA